MKRILFLLKTPFQFNRSFIVIGLLFTTTVVFGTVKSTVADGDWFNAANWSPVGVPLMEDSVVVNHDITALGDKVEFGASWLIVTSTASITCDSIFALHGNLRLYGTMDIQTYVDGDGTNSYIHGLLSGESAIPGNPSTYNYGTISSDSLTLGDAFYNHGLLDVDVLIAGSGSAPFNNYSSAAIVVSNSAIFSTEVLNQINATMVFGSLMTDVLITNNGSVSCSSWSHLGGIANGSGRYCVEMCFQNYADIEGTLDICDASPMGFCDFEFGTTAGTITYCAVSACNNNLGLEEGIEVVQLYPNPAFDFIVVENAILESTWTILDMNGNVILSGITNSSLTEININDLSGGVYTLTIQNEKESDAHRFVKN